MRVFRLGEGGERKESVSMVVMHVIRGGAGGLSRGTVMGRNRSTSAEGEKIIVIGGKTEGLLRRRREL